MKIVPTERSQQLAAQVREINDFIQQHALEGGTHQGYRRVFNCGDAEGFAWNKGGRLYGQGENYQQLKKGQRLRMLIDGEPVVEVDVRASYLTILHALRGVPLDLSRDPYDVPGLPRGVVKQWVTMTLGHHGFHRRWPKDIADEYFKEHDEGLSTAHPVREVQRAVLTALPVLADWPEQTLTCFDLMFLESQAIVRTMLRLKREHGVVCLSVHDSVIVPAAQEAMAEHVLKEEYARVVGVEPDVRINRPDRYLGLQVGKCSRSRDLPGRPTVGREKPHNTRTKARPRRNLRGLPCAPMPSIQWVTVLKRVGWYQRPDYRVRRC